DADGANAAQVTSDPGLESEPAWSRDGERIYFSRSADGGSQIASVAIDGSDLQVLTSVPGGHLSPVVSPDGRTIAFVTARDGNYEVYQMDADGGNARRLTDTREREQLPRFLPNGDIVFLRDRSGGGTDIIRLGQDGASVLTESEDPVLGLAVARDGNEITYVTGRMPDRSGTRIEYRLVTQQLTVGATPVVIRFEPGEQVATPSY